MLKFWPEVFWRWRKSCRRYDGSVAFENLEIIKYIIRSKPQKTQIKMLSVLNSFLKININ